MTTRTIPTGQTVQGGTCGPVRLLLPGASTPEWLSEYRAGGGYAPEAWDLSPAELIDAVDASGLRGRGGAAFPAGRKWQAVAERTGPRASSVVLVNAAESEPASRKDLTLLLQRPHLVIEGALLAARAVAAEEIVFYLHDHQTAARATLEEALAELRDAMRRAKTKLPRWRIVTAPAGYVAGEETAAVRRVNGGPAKPTTKPPRPFERGVRNRPTLVQNVETLANVPLIARHGPAWFREAGTGSLPGTLLVTLSGAVARPGVYEVESGAPLRRVLDELGGGTDDGSPVQAALIGGYFAGWLSGTEVGSVRLEPASLGAHGVALGSAAIVVVPESSCGLAQAARLLGFFADESARQCGPCTFGTQAMADVFARLEHGRATTPEVARLRLWAEQMLPRRGACGHLDGAAVAARTALSVFAEEIERHARGGCGRDRSVVLPELRQRTGGANGAA